MIEETWEEGKEINVEVGGYHIFRHSSEAGSSGRKHLFQGVAIILSPEFHAAWCTAGLPLPITTEKGSKVEGRFISISLKFPCYNSHGKKIKDEFLKIALTLIYYPCKDREHEKFNSSLQSLLERISDKTDTIIGADVNTRVGI